MFPHAAACRRSAPFVLAAGPLPSSVILHCAMVGALASGILHSAMVGALQRRAEANSKHIFKSIYQSIYYASIDRSLCSNSFYLCVRINGTQHDTTRHDTTPRHWGA